MTDIVKSGPGGIAKPVSKWEEELAKLAADASETEYGGGSFISTQAGQLSINGEDVKDNKLNVVIVDYIYENIYYGEKFNPKVKKPPLCFALNREQDQLAPHPESLKPQAPDCAHCPQNVFGSDPEGDGKACKNIRRLGLISSDITPDAVPGTEVLYLKTPVTSTKAWGIYVKTLNSMFSRPPFGVVTQISTVPHKQHQYHLTFTPIGLLEDAMLEPVMEKRDVVMDSIAFPYQKPAEAEAPAAPDSKKF